MTERELRPLVDRMLEEIKHGTRMPPNATDKNFVELLTCVLDVLIPTNEQDDPEEVASNTGIPILNAPGMELSARMRGGRQPVSKADIARAKLDMFSRLPPPRRK